MTSDLTRWHRRSCTFFRPLASRFSQSKP